jgi:thiol-disulfide isomerase/thioredoxin
MKTLLQIVVFALMTGTAQAQIYWYDDLETAKNNGIKKGKLILVDFWASWCGPCQTMNRDLWSLPEVAELSRNFVAAKINVDIDMPTALDFQVQGIPKVVIILPNKEILWERVGYGFATDYLNVLRGLPSDVSELYNKIDLLEKNKNDCISNFQAGIEFQNTGRNTAYKILSVEFYSLGLQCFKKALKNCAVDSLRQEIELYTVLTEVFLNNPKKALKTMGNITDSNSGSKNIQQLTHYILASCYKLQKDEVNFLKEKELITRSDFLDQLNR